MTDNRLICKMLDIYLQQNPTIRFGQALHNLNINLFSETIPHPVLKDIYADSDEKILERVKESLRSMQP